MREGACGLVCAERALTFALSAGLPGAPVAADVGLAHRGARLDRGSAPFRLGAEPRLALDGTGDVRRGDDDVAPRPRGDEQQREEDAARRR